jgi:hypothetical protein
MKEWGFTVAMIDNVFISLIKTGMFNGIYASKWIVFGLLVISLIGYFEEHHHCGMQNSFFTFTQRARR